MLLWSHVQIIFFLQKNKNFDPHFIQDSHISNEWEVGCLNSVCFKEKKVIGVYGIPWVHLVIFGMYTYSKSCSTSIPTFSNVSYFELILNILYASKIQLIWSLLSKKSIERFPHIFMSYSGYSCVHISSGSSNFTLLL